MARNYFNLDEVEIDNLLMVNLFPKKRERINFSNRNNFIDILMPEIIKRNAQADFIKNILQVFNAKRGVNGAMINSHDPSLDLNFYYDLVFAPPKPIHLKLAVLITIDSLE